MFHEVAWLVMCPFHGVPLQVAQPPRYYGTILEHYIRTLQYVMKIHCAGWPLVQRGPADDGLGSVPASILDWASRSTKSSAEFSDKDILLLNSRGLSDSSFNLHKLGQIYVIEPVPEEIKMYVKSVDVNWRIEYRRFDRGGGYFYPDVEGRRAISVLFDFYMKTQPLSHNPPPYVEYLNSLIEALRTKQIACRCDCFDVVETTGEVLWRKVIGVHGQSYRRRCPYEMTLDELEARWGRWTEVWAKRLADQEFGRLIVLSQSARDFGFVRLASDDATCSDEYFQHLHSPFDNYTWTLEPSELDLLNAAAKWQIEAEFDSMTVWLDSLNSDREPLEYAHPAGFVRIQSDGDELVLMRWVRDVDAS
ncbi:hypothetical protein [Burkholderia sp. JP2-270]|uniref:hypothetical protein n=1 Tax=Burkholderia sp. JP2-270 TaxID=2217913 RepID=UPI001EF78EB8|nr:hypothetical protein [Burkholderia sp. JP2-270]